MDHPPSTAEPAAPGGWATSHSGVGFPDLAGQARQLVAAFSDAVAQTGAAEQLVGLRSMIDQLEAAWLSALGAFDRADGPVAEGAGSTPAWLRTACRIPPGEASQRVQVARALSGRLPLTTAAMAEGAVSWRHAVVVERATRGLPATLSTRVEQLLQEPAKRLDPVLLQRVAHRPTYVLDPDSADAAAKKRFDRRGLTLAETLGGMISVTGLLDPTTGAPVLAAIDAMVAPSRGTADERSWAQRRADALAELCRGALDNAALPTVGGERPHVSVIVDLPSLRNELGCGCGEASWVGPLKPEQVRLLSCDAEVTRIVMGSPSQVLDVGRATRTVPIAIRKAVVARDKHCIARGCWRPPEHCDVHHRHFWADGGVTSVDNCVLLCRVHHNDVHTRGWSVARLGDGAFTLVPWKALRQGRPPPD